MTPEEADRLHDEGLMPDWAWFAQNGRSTQYNIDYQIRKIDAQTKKIIRQREKAKRKEEAKKQLEQQIVDAITQALEQGTDIVAENAANDIVNSIDNAFNGGGSFNMGNKTYTAQLGEIVGRALGDAPFKLLDDILDDED